MNILSKLAYALLVVVPWSFALELSDLHLPMTRDEADTTLSKDYESTLLRDGSVRRTWKLDNRTVFVDFNSASNEGILIAVIYDKPVSLKVGQADAKALAAGKLEKKPKWSPPKDKEARIKVREVYGLEGAMRTVLSDKTKLFYETGKEKGTIVRVSLFLRSPSTNRWVLQEIPRDAERTALGNQMTPQHIKEMYADEERRRAIPLKSDIAADEGSTQSEQSDSGESSSSKTTITIKVPQHRTQQDKAQESDAVVETTALGSPGTKVSDTPKPEKIKITMDRGQRASEKLTFLATPPDWLKKVGIENPTWWHYIGIAVVLLLLVIMMLRAVLHASSSAARRRRFNEVINQGGQPKVRSKRR